MSTQFPTPLLTAQKNRQFKQLSQWTQTEIAEIIEYFIKLVVFKSIGKKSGPF